MKAIVAQRVRADRAASPTTTGPSRSAVGDTVVIEAEAIGVNYPDGLLVQGLYQMKP